MVGVTVVMAGAKGVKANSTGLERFSFTLKE